MKITKLFEPCFMEYDQLDKPVQYTGEFLKELTEKTSTVKLVYEEHSSEAIGEVSNLNFIEGSLFGVVTSDKSTENLGYSPYIECSLEDHDDYWRAVNPTGLADVALTSKPRKPIKLPNTEDGGSNMSNDGNTDNETIKILNSQVKDLNKQLAVQETKLKANEKKLKKYDETQKELKELKEWKEINSKIIEEQKPIIEEYKQSLEAKREDLIKKLANGNAEIEAQLKEASMETLELYNTLTSHEEPPKGVGADNAPGLNEGSGEDDDNPSKEDMQSYFKSQFGDE